MSHSNNFDLKSIQFWIKKKILAYHQKMLPYPLSDLFTGLIFGEHGTALPQSYKIIFKKTGLTHLLVVSGSQVALIVGIVFVVLQFFNLNRNTILLSVIAASLFFYGVTGGGASVLRAVIMSILVSAFKLYQYRVSVLYVISNTAILMILIDPLIIFDFGAYLSFLATLSLIYGVPFLSNILPNRWPLFLKMLISMSLAPFCVTLPFLWFFFHKVSLMSVLSNLIMVPLIELLVVLGFFSTLIGLIIPPITMPLMMGIRLILDLKILLIETLSQFSWSEYAFGRPPVFVMITLYLLIGCCLAPIPDKLKRNISLLSVIGFIIMIVHSVIKAPHFTVTVLDVGQGDCIIIECPNGKTLLIDSAKNSFVARQVILPYLAYRGINVIDAMIITHYDKDHYGGVSEIIRSVKVKTIIDNGNLVARVSKLGSIADDIPIYRIQSGDRINLDPSVKIRCLSASSIIRSSDKNNRSISLLIQYKSKKFLFTGDLESIGEKWISRIYNPIDVDVLKLGHHGSKTSSTSALLKWCTPEIGIVSAGRKNRYRHPHPSVLDRCQLYGISVFRTDLDGAIKLLTDGSDLKIIAYLKQSPILSVVQ
jgi:competence protein ComEC